MFEVVKCDLAGRIGVLHTAHGRVGTPAFVPVVHPVRQAIPAADVAAVGFDMVITNAYISMRRHGDAATRRGIHGIIGYDGPVMTDSGGYQVLEYGDVSVEPEDMAAYEESIGADVAVPLDRPTGMGLRREEAEQSVSHTLWCQGGPYRAGTGGPGRAYGRGPCRGPST